ncbi:MAG: hypothetical protein ACRCT1_15020 [Microcoleaceae cyanobacterium]
MAISRVLSSQEKRDLEEMASKAPNAHPTDANGTIVWTEWTDQNGYTYQLVYWYDTESGDYQAGVVEGASYTGHPWQDHIFSDGRLSLRGSSDDKCTSVFQVRNQAIVWAFGHSRYRETGVWELLSI